MNVTEYRYMDADKVRRVCITHEWYRSGSNEDYDAMLTKCKSYSGMSSERQIGRLLEIATDIFDHSDIDLGYYGHSEEEYIAHIMCVLIQECVVVAYAVE